MLYIFFLKAEIYQKYIQFNEFLLAYVWVICLKADKGERLLRSYVDRKIFVLQFIAHYGYMKIRKITYNSYWKLCKWINACPRDETIGRVTARIEHIMVHNGTWEQTIDTASLYSTRKST